MKRIMVIALGCLTIFMGSVINAEEKLIAPLFPDLVDHWAGEIIASGVEGGYVEGYPDRTFRPDSDVTRAEFLQMTTKALELFEINENETDPWYAPAVEVSIQSGLHKEHDFSVDYDKPLNRKEMARIAVRATDDELRETKEEIDDRQFIYEATTKGILRGMEDGRINHEGLSTRAQAVTIIERILTLKAGGALEIDERAVSYAATDLKRTNVEEMWGLEPKEFPMEIKINNAATATINQMVIVDTSDPNFLYNYLFENAMTNADLEESYVIALHVSIDVDGSGREGSWMYHQQTFGMSIVPRVVFDENSYGLKRAISLFEENAYEGWIGFTRSKENTDQAIIGNYVAPIELDVSGRFILLTKETRR